MMRKFHSTKNIRGGVKINLLAGLAIVVILGILIALLLPAVQPAREAARRMAALSRAKMAPEMAPAEQESLLPGDDKFLSGVEATKVIETAGLSRKLIYTATIELTVEDFNPLPMQIEALAKEFGGYVSSATIFGAPGSPRSGEWTIRVPVEHYEAALVRARALGEIRRISSESKDVTEEYYDVDARIRNKKQEEARLLKLLEEAPGKLEEILAAEKELFRVRGEVEQLEGRLRVLSELTSLSTIHLEVYEAKQYTPEDTTTYPLRLRRAWKSSLDMLVLTAQNVSIGAVALAPWLAILIPLVVLVALITCWAGKRFRRAKN